MLKFNYETTIRCTDREGTLIAEMRCTCKGPETMTRARALATEHGTVTLEAFTADGDAGAEVQVHEDGTVTADDGAVTVTDEGRKLCECEGPGAGAN